MVPGSLIQESPGVSVTGPGNPTLRAALASGVLTGYQSKVGADGPATQASPVTNLNSQGERSQRGDAPEARQVISHLRVLTISGHSNDCLIQHITPVKGRHQRLVIRVKGNLQGWLLKLLLT